MPRLRYAPAIIMAALLFDAAFVAPFIVIRYSVAAVVCATRATCLLRYFIFFFFVPAHRRYAA